MLDIKEIQKKLDAGEIVYLEHNVRGKALNELYFSELEKLEVGYVNINENGLRDGVYIKDGSGHVRNSSYFIPKEELKYFRIKRATPTFDDLIDVAVRAAKDDVIVIRRFHSSFLDFEEYGTTKHADNVGVSSSSAEDIKDAINFINSLYTETFVIEGEEDIKRIKQYATIEFQNGNKVAMDNPPCDTGIVRIWDDGRYDFTVLKGATVTQKRGVL